MKLENKQYYHIYIDSEHQSHLFTHFNEYGFFLNKFRSLFDEVCHTLAYCMLEKHVHLLVYVHDIDNIDIQDRFNNLFKEFTQRFRKYDLTLQKSYKAVIEAHEIDKLAKQIHLEPVKYAFVATPEEWEFSSYLEYIGQRKGTFPHMDEIKQRYNSDSAYKAAVNSDLDEFEDSYWL